jgi:transglutaminase-like putative cysteine protease
VRSRARTLLAAGPAVAVVVLAWLRLEQPQTPLWRVAALAGLGLAAAAAPRWWRAAATLAAAAGAARLALGVSLVPPQPLDPSAGFGLDRVLSALAVRLGDGFADFYSTRLPFDPRLHVAMGGLVLVAVFSFSLAVALLAAARRPVAAGLVLLAGAGWPSTLLGSAHGIAMGAAILAAALVLLAGLGLRRLPASALPAAAVVALAGVAAGTATAGRQGLVHWQSWNLAHPTASVGLGFVWTPQYGGLHWPRRRTVVLQVQAARRPAYLRAAVLDDFVGQAWAAGTPRPADALEPRAAFQPDRQSREVVTVEALADTRLVGGSVPVRFAAGGAPLVQPEPGFALLPTGLVRGFRYTVWTYSPRPGASALRRSPPSYPAQLVRDGMLAVGGGAVAPPFGAPRRAAALRSLVRREPGLEPYLPLARLAEQVAGRARTPYDAVADLERWFLVAGGFRYSNHPPVVSPPLVGFVTRTRAGYCQYFAGAMALMLRYLGIPARVAVGFAGGTYQPSSRLWLVTDHDAHAWVEVWFKGYGWLPFDPTPPVPGSARDPLGGGSPAAGVADVTLPGPGVPGQLGRYDPPATPGSHLRGRSGAAEQGPAGASQPRPNGGSGVTSLVLALGGLVLAAGGVLVSTKLALRTLARRGRDPRRVAAACRRELAAFLADQRVEVPASATLHELGQVVRQEFGVEPGAFVTAAATARFGREPAAAVAAREAKRELAELLRLLRGCLTRRDRLRGLLSLRSLGPSAAAERPRSASLGRTGS